METRPIFPNFLSTENFSQNVAEFFETNVEKEVLNLYPLFGSLLSGLWDRIRKCQDTKRFDMQPNQCKEIFVEVKCEYFELSICCAALFNTVESSELENLRVGVKCDKKPAKKILLSKIENFIQQLCRAVLIYHRQETCEKFVFMKTSKLPFLLTNEKEVLKTEQLQLFRDNTIFTKQIEHYLQCVISTLGLMRRLLEFQKTSINFSSTIASFYVAKCEALSLKLRILHLKILTETYTFETVPVCRRINEQLQFKQTKMEQDLAGKKTILQCYEAVGQSFDVLVQEYTKLSVAIDNEKWALEQWTKSEELM